MVDEPVRGRLPGASFWSLPGIEQARARLRGTVPRSPLSHLIGLRLTQVGAGSATVTMPASPWLQSGDGAVEVRMLLEEALALAVTTGAPAGHEVRTAALSVNQLRLSGLDSDTFVARARVLNSGSLFTLAEVQAEDGTGRAVAHASGSFLIQPIDPAPPPFEEAVGPMEEPVYSTPDPYLRPLAGAFRFEGWHEEGGLAWIRDHLAGEKATLPILGLLNGGLVDVEEGVIRFTTPATQWLCSRSGEVSPGVLATLAFFGLGVVVTVAPPGHRVGTVEQSITLLRPVPPDGRHLLSHGTVVHHAADLVVSTVEVTDADGNRVALGYQTGVIRERRARRSPAADRVLATVLFTDIVGSTGHAEDLGDARWRELLEEHHAVVRKQLTVFRGREVKTTGDGFLATFDSPGRAVQAARAIRDALRRVGLEVRAGLHTGEYEISGTDVAGIAVHIASRVQAFAGPGEVVVTSTVRDLVTGSGLRFTDRGRQQLKGIDGDWQLFALAE
jgi:class 3 adenylate cyclase